jgi:hypothetical protein
MVVESEQGYAPDDRGCEPPPRVEHDHRGSRDEDDDASHGVAPAVEGISRLRINRSVSLSFSGIATFSRQFLGAEGIEDVGDVDGDLVLVAATYGGDVVLDRHFTALGR